MEKRSFQKLIMYVSIVLIFIAAVVLVFCAREVKNTTEQVNDTIKSNLDYASVSCENILTDAVNVLNVNYFTTQYIHEKNEDNAMLKEYFVEQTEYLKDRLGLSYLGIYGYIGDHSKWNRSDICNAIYRYEDGKTGIDHWKNNGKRNRHGRGRSGHKKSVRNAADAAK